MRKRKTPTVICKFPHSLYYYLTIATTNTATTIIPLSVSLQYHCFTKSDVNSINYNSSTVYSSHNIYNCINLTYICI